ncbi:signal transduction histidine kinase [Neomicrococcus aestuarii]|uniref:histidine kinase n=1 Tax=Neomicrococcus aestuarii TaxID=556325 RepID=A0A7W8TVE3_9MICC|nr:HAMP domain-containing sensor histidine kinase [Neomicrococcus aestuarii]MBB5513617.1 signal transduction histidine kinase [Neomicrococcus aestuarii]
MAAKETSASPEAAAPTARIAPAFSKGTVGGRVLVAIILLTLTTLVAAGASMYLIQRGQTIARLDDSLTRSVDEFRALAQEGVNPETGQRFTKAEDLAYVAMQRTMPSTNEGLVALSENRVRWVAPDHVELRLEADQELLDFINASADSGRVSLATVTTAQREYRVVSIPVKLDGDSSEVRFALAYDMGAELFTLTRGYVVFGGVALGILALASLASWILVRRLLAPLTKLEQTSARITENQLDERVPVEGTDDLRALAGSFNEMVDHLQSSLQAQRQLLDDVGHELRTPITIVQGHLELQDNDDPDDVRNTQELSLDELARMNLLVDDIVTIAQANRKGFVHTETVDISSLLDDILSKAHGLGQRQWEIRERVSGEVTLDPQRITQAMLQLCSNAVKFSPRDSRIALGAAISNGLLRLWVRDEGIGISEEDQSRIFTRFARGTNGSRHEGSGLGLSIVQAIATAHGGHVSVFSHEGEGSIFSIYLPLHTAPSTLTESTGEHS